MPRSIVESKKELLKFDASATRKMRRCHKLVDVLQKRNLTEGYFGRHQHVEGLEALAKNLDQPPVVKGTEQAYLSDVESKLRSGGMKDCLTALKELEDGLQKAVDASDGLEKLFTKVKQQWVKPGKMSWDLQVILLKRVKKIAAERSKH